MKDAGELSTGLLDGPHAEHIHRLVAVAPPLSDAQRSRLATILRQPVAADRMPTPSSRPAKRGVAA